jgi:hypothetical protein
VKMLTLFGGLCCVGIMNPVGVVAGVQRYYLLILGPFEYVPFHDRGRIQSPKCCFN